MKIINVFDKYPNLLFSFVIVTLVGATILLLVLDKKCKGCTESNIGIITAMDPIPSSFNSKTAVRMENTFYVVFGFPQLEIGDSLVAKKDGNKIIAIKDDTGDWYDVLHKTQ